jgi:D-serine dehydratase
VSETILTIPSQPVDDKTLYDILGVIEVEEDTSLSPAQVI